MNITNELIDFLETHYEVVKEVEKIFNLKQPYGIVLEIIETQGFGGLYQLAQELTSKFHAIYKDTDWGVELEWFDTLQEFLKEELK